MPRRGARACPLFAPGSIVAFRAINVGVAETIVKSRVAQRAFGTAVGTAKLIIRKVPRDDLVEEAGRRNQRCGDR